MEHISALLPELNRSTEKPQKPLPASTQGSDDLPVQFKATLAKFPEQKDFIVNMNHVALEKRYDRIMTVADAYQTNYIKLEELEYIYAKETPVLLLESWILQLSLFAKVPINKDQIHELALLLYDDCRFLNMAELTLFFKRVKKGHYGEFYADFNTMALMRWAREYRKERGMYISKLP